MLKIDSSYEQNRREYLENENEGNEKTVLTEAV